MKRSVGAPLIALLTLGLTWGCTASSDQPAAAPDPAQVLRQMSDTLAAANHVTFKATRTLDAALSESGVVPESAEIDVAISRPDKLQATSTASSGVRRFFADGRNISLVDDAAKIYSTVPLAGSIDAVLDGLDEIYGFVPPLADFAANDPGKRFSRQIQGSRYQGRETINGVACDRVAVTGDIADADIWVSTEDHLPRRFLAVFKDRDVKASMTVDFSEWNLAATPDEARFVFTPAADVEPVTMRSDADQSPAEEVNGNPPVASTGSAK